jgi:YesN/AraC family two-component response regulator
MNNDFKQLTAMIVDDEAPMRQHLKLQLKKIWPELLIIAEANNGIHALEQAEKNMPDIIFLDIRMPGKNGIEAATQLTQHAQVIFVTAYDEYAIQAFEKGAVDYLLKPVDNERLILSCERLKQTFKNKENIFFEQSKQSDETQANQMKKLLTQLVEQQIRQQNSNKEYLHWIQPHLLSGLV